MHVCVHVYLIFNMTHSVYSGIKCPRPSIGRATELDLVEPSGPASFPRLVAAAHEKLGLKQELSVALCKQVSRLADAVGGEL